MSYQAWTAPAASSHPRIWMTTGSLSTIQSRVASTHAAYWARLIQWATQALGRALSSWISSEAEDIAGLAFAYLVDPTREDLAARAQEVALYLADQPIAGGDAGRHRMLGLALVYDWAYEWFDRPTRAILRARIMTYVERYYPTDPSEKIQGSSLGNNAMALTAIIAILEDGSIDENAYWRTIVDYLLDQFLPGAGTTTGYLSLWRDFGTTAGAPLGSGPGSWTAEAEGFFARLMPALSTGLAVPWETMETWWDGFMGWTLWHLRGDQTLHRSWEQACTRPYHPGTQLHLIQAASRDATIQGRAWTWLAEKFQAVLEPLGDGIVGGRELWQICFRDMSKVPEKLTIASAGGAQMKVIGRSGKIVIRDSFDAGTSLTIEASPHFLGGHQRRRQGHFNLEVLGSPIFYEKGGLDPAQDLTPKDPADSAQSGHRYTYSQRIPAANVVRIFDTDEPTENPGEVFRRLLSPDTAYGVISGGAVTISNDGGQVVPKSSPGSRDRPWDHVDLLGDPKWTYSPAPLATPPFEDSKYCYVLAQLAGCYRPEKLTKWNRHILWVKAGAIPGWRYPVILIYDDIISHVDAVAGAATQVLQLNAVAAPSTQGSYYYWTRGNGKCYVLVQQPFPVIKNDIADYQINGVSYPVTAPAAFDDPAGVRTEFYGTSATGTRPFLLLFLPVPVTVNTPPTVTLSEDATWVGFTINGVLCRIRKTTPFGGNVGASPDVIAPSALVGLTAIAATGSVALAWTASVASDFEFYRVWRGTSGTGPWTLIGSPVTNSFRDEAVVNGTAYYYQVAAVDTSGNESDRSASAGPATPALGIAGPVRHPQARSRTGEAARYSRAWRDREYEDPDPLR